jgi:predicted O-methyltransferase YrrM
MRRAPLSLWRLSALLAVARDRDRIVELGTAAGWTAYSLALANPRARVTTYDWVEHPNRERYRSLVPPDVLDRVDQRLRLAQRGPEEPTECDLLLVDADHEHEPVLEMTAAWYASVVPGGLVVFDDYASEFPGVREAIEDLGFDGRQVGRLFVHRKQ